MPCGAGQLSGGAAMRDSSAYTKSNAHSTALILPAVHPPEQGPALLLDQCCSPMHNTAPPAAAPTMTPMLDPPVLPPGGVSTLRGQGLGAVVPAGRSGDGEGDGEGDGLCNRKGITLTPESALTRALAEHGAKGRVLEGSLICTAGSSVRWGGCCQWCLHIPGMVKVRGRGRAAWMAPVPVWGPLWLGP